MSITPAEWFEERAKNTPMPGARYMFRMAAEALREKAECEKQDKITPVLCKDCGMSVYNECSGLRKCRSQRGLHRVVEDNEFCSWGEPKEED